MYKMPNNIFNQIKNRFKNTNVTVMGLILITILFLGYNYFTGHNSGNTPSVADRIKEALTRKGTVTPDAAKDDRRAEIAKEESPEVAGASTVWKATDYKSGDIKQGSYVVKKGDTLWEIAEAVYGDGTQWHKILEANKSSIGFLPNGSQALIIPSQTLVLP